MPAAASSVLPILVVDDDPAFRGFVRKLLERAGFDVREAADGNHALSTARLARPSLVVLDIVLPGINGYEVLRELQDTIGHDLPVILVSGDRTDKEDVVAGLLLGADDYVIKPFDPDEFLARVRRSLRRGHAPRPSLNGSPSVLAVLTSREVEVLGLLAEGLTQAEIAARLFVSPRTVGTHIQHILSKLDVHSRAQAVALALRQGLDAGELVAHERGSAPRRGALVRNR